MRARTMVIIKILGIASIVTTYTYVVVVIGIWQKVIFREPHNLTLQNSLKSTEVSGLPPTKGPTKGRMHDIANHKQLIDTNHMHQPVVTSKLEHAVSLSHHNCLGRESNQTGRLHRVSM